MDHHHELINLLLNDNFSGKDVKLLISKLESSDWHVKHDYAYRCNKGTSSIYIFKYKKCMYLCTTINNFLIIYSYFDGNKNQYYYIMDKEYINIIGYELMIPDDMLATFTQISKHKLKLELSHIINNINM